MSLLIYAFTGHPEPSDNTNMLSHTLKAAKADLRKRFTLSKGKSWTRLDELEPLVSSEGTISSKPAKRSLFNTLFDTKTGRKLHKRSRSDPTPQSDPTGQLPELELVLQPYEDARIFSVGTNQALDAVYDATASSREYYSCTSGSYDASYEVDEWSISDHGTVLIRRPAGFHPTRSTSLISCSTHHTNADVQAAEATTTVHGNVADNDSPIAVEENIISDSEVHDNEPSDYVQQSSGNHNHNMGSHDNNLHARFVQPVSMTQISRVMSKVIEGRTKTNLILRPIRELRRKNRTVSGSSKKNRKTEHGARRFFLAANKATTTTIVDEHDDALAGPAPESIHESDEDDHDANDNTHVDEDAMSQPHAGEEQFHQLSTRESRDTGSIDSIHDNLAQCDMIVAAYQGEYDQLERAQTRTSDLCDTLREPNDADVCSEPEQLEFTEEKAALESWAQASTHWGDPNIGPDTVRQGFEEHLKILKRLHTSDAKGKNIELTPSIDIDHRARPTVVLPERKNNSAKCREMFLTGDSLRDELAEALYHPQARHIAGAHPQKAMDAYCNLAFFRAERNEEENRLDRDLGQVRERIDARSAQLERFCALIQRLEQQNEAKAARRRQAIYRRVSQLIKTTGAELAQAMSRCVEKREHYRELLYREKALVEAVQDEARHIGLGNHTPNELEWAAEQMVAGDSLEYVEDALHSCF
ncbi:hypothetical protein LRP88_08562 [Fusarium phalaenopsidis]